MAVYDEVGFRLYTVITDHRITLLLYCYKMTQTKIEITFLTVPYHDPRIPISVYADGTDYAVYTVLYRPPRSLTADVET